MSESHNIDIEEHDVLENPLIRKIFPDLSLIKQEIQAFFYEAQDIDQKQIHNEKKQIAPTGSRELIKFEDDRTSVEDVVELKLTKDKEHCTKNMPKPNTSIEKKSFANKIILGSKPNKPKQKNKNILAPTLFDLKIQLHDVKSYLNRSNRFCRICLTLFSNSNDIHKHNAKFHTMLQNKGNLDQNYLKINKGLQLKCNKIKTNHNKRQITLNDIISSSHSHKDVIINNKQPNQCFHCNKIFEFQHSLIEHLSTLQVPQLHCKTCGDSFIDKKKLQQHILQHFEASAKTNGLSKNNFNREKINARIKEIKSINLYMCQYCHSYFKTQKNYVLHLSQNHSVTKIPKYHKTSIIQFDCKYCSLRFKNIILYNQHIRREHKIHLNFKPYSNCHLTENNDSQSFKLDMHNKKPILQETLVLKSTIFKCIKCDVHFLSAKETSCHVDHIEELVNWKCSVCYRIFKEKDKTIHLKQHTVLQSLIVYELSEELFSRVLYKCLKCAVHFTEHNFIFHYPICGYEIPNSGYCRKCDIIIESDSFTLHINCHARLKLVLSDFIILDSEILIIGNSGTPSNPTPSEQTVELHEEFDSKGLNNSVDVNKSIKVSNLLKNSNNVNMSYCKTCKCFIICSYAREVHLKFKCKDLVKYVCKSCGLILTQKSMVSHKIMHNERKNLNLQDFNFFDIKTGVQISPPLPDFPKCINCGVHFITKESITHHICAISKMEYLTCQICQLKFTERAFKLHVPFHYYSLFASNNKKLNDEQSQQAITNCKRQKVADVETNSPVDNSMMKEIEAEFTNIKNDQETIIYCCKNCSIAFETYDNVIEHCQNHYSNSINMSVKKCKTCKLEFEKNLYCQHQEKHLTNKKFKLLNFDIFYFLSESNDWYKHIFKSLNQKQIENILNESIYSIERRIKMKIIQNGVSNLTMYQCDKCRGFVDETSVYMHTTYSCLNVKKYPCSVCCLEFVTSVSKRVHEKIHNANSLIDVKLYRIVLFNQSEDKFFNDAISRSPFCYTMYQCRNCNAIVNKDILETHECNKLELFKCSDCGLLLVSKDYESHIWKHKEFDSFTPENIKVILIGQCDQATNKLSIDSMFSFKGIIDFTFYECSKCKVCVKNLTRTVSHVCPIETFKSTCGICGLRFTMRQIKKHINTFHHDDSDFRKEYLNVISFLPDNKSLTDSTNEPMETTREVYKDKSTLRVGCTNLLFENSSHIVTLYKCKCGLHFLNELSITEHFSICNLKNISKQNCSKCDLLFTPKILFTHLLKHHCNKNNVTNFDIIEVKEKP